jgi:chloramphenicol-sensitive protein RarD
LVLVALTGVATVVPLMLFAWAAQRVPLTVLGPMQYLIPTINFLLGWLVYHEDLPLWRVVGFALVWCGLVLVTVDTVQRGRAARSGRFDPPAVPRDGSTVGRTVH